MITQEEVEVLNKNKEHKIRINRYMNKREFKTEYTEAI